MCKGSSPDGGGSGSGSSSSGTATVTLTNAPPRGAGSGSGCVGSAAGCTPAAAPAGLSGEGGKVEHSDKAVEVRTGVKLKKNGHPTYFNDMISIKVKCAKNPHVVQFLHRELIGADGRHKSLSTQTSSRAAPQKFTTDPAHPEWITDSDASPDPSYEAGGASRDDPGSLTTFDEPTVETTPVGPLDLADGETSKATFKAYTFCDGKVVKEVTWVISVTHPGSPKYTVTVKDATELPQWAKDTLKNDGFNAAP